VVRRSAAYPYRTTADEWSSIAADAQAEEQLFGRLAAELIAEWITLAEDRLRGTGVRCLIGAGNDDPWSIDGVLESAEFVEVPDWRVLDLDGFALYTVGDATTTPWNSPRELTEDAYAAKLAMYVVGSDDNFERAIFNLHVPPYVSGLDNAPAINERFEVQYAAGEPIMRPVGSTAVRAAIEKYQPLLGLHGHVHESPGAVRLGKTLCVNPGSDYGANLLRGALLTLDRRKGLKGYQLTVG
jgi:Icc-related predicted phosphoesterase